MDYLDQAKALSAVELRARLAEFGEVVGPILPTTQPLFQKRLARKLAAASATSESPDNKVTYDESSTDGKETPVTSEEKKKEKNIKKNNDGTASQYFGVCLPGNANEMPDEEEDNLVFTDKTEALKEVKKHTGARFKVFKTREEAKQFSRLPSDGPSPWKQPQTKQTVETAGGQGSVMSVEGCPYKAPKPPEVSEFRKTIEAGDYRAVETMVWENPRFLISSGDTPVILQEGFRYNALHVAAKFNQPTVCQLVMDTIEDPNFVDKLYSHTNETQQTRTNRINFLVDLYLNMPDKGNCESPLHFACKFGFGDVVSVLIAHPKVDKDLRNKYGETAADIICSRCSGATDTDKSQIRELLLGQYYVPLVRSEDNTTQPVIGHPWLPDMSKNPLNVSLSSWNPKDPLMAVKACAGPMTPSKAERFHKQWVTPPTGSPDYVRRKFVETRREDSDKGLERLGRELAHKLKIPWLEYWEFLQTYVDLSSEDGFELLEEYFQKQRIALCLADGIEKLDIIMNRSFHGNKEMGFSNFSWNLLSLTEELEDVFHDSASEKDKVNHLEGIKEDVTSEKSCDTSPQQQNGSACKMENGSVSHNGTPPPMRSSMHRSNLYSTPVSMETYGRYFMNRSMDRSDLMNQSVESITNSSSPISCLSALFARLSLLDRSRSSRGSMKALSCTSCMGNKSAYMTSSDYPMDASFASSTGSRPYAKVPYFKEALDKYKESVASEDPGDKPNKSNDIVKPMYNFLERTRRPEKSVTILDELESKDYCSEKSNSVSLDASKTSDLSDKETFHSCPSNVSEKGVLASNLEESIDQLKDLDLDNEKKAGDTSDDSDLSWQTASNHLNLVLEMDRDQISGAMFESLFETLNERKNIENIPRYFKESSSSPSHNKQDIVLDLKDENVFISDSVIANVAVIPLHSSVTDMRLFPDIPFKVIKGDDSMDRSVEGTLPSLVDVKFNFGRDTVMQALAISNSLKSKIFYIHGYMPTKSDLDAYRAIELSSVDKNKYPLVVQWKSQISSHATDSTFSWQSPAKVRKQSNLSSSFPQTASPASKHNSVIIYNSPVSGGSPRRSMSSTWSTPNLQTRLFSPLPNRLSLNLDD